jgi:hypothetical protein
MAVAPEAIAYLGSGTIIVVNVIGWVIAADRNRQAVQKAADAAAEAAGKELAKVTASVNGIKSTVEKLPCVKDTRYLQDNGRLMANQENQEKNLVRLEKKVDEVLLHLKNGAR